MVRNHVKRLKIDKFHLSLIDIRSILPDIERKIINDIYEYQLSLEKGSKDLKSIIYHHLILDICTEVKEATSVYKVVSYHDVKFLDGYMKEEESSIFFAQTMKKLNNLLPINIWESPYDFKVMRKVLQTPSGERIELEYQLNKFTDTRKKSLYSFNKIKKFGKRYGLQFLTKNFFEKIENKQLIIS